VVDDPVRAREDVRTLRPLYQALGITVAALRGGAMETEPAAAETPDVCYGQLRDLVLAASRRVHGSLPPHLPESACALVDDLDTILVDDAAHPVAVPPGPDRPVTAERAEPHEEPAAAPTAQAW